MARRDVIRRGRALIIKEGVDFMPISHLTDLIQEKIKSLGLRGYSKLAINNYQVGTLLGEVDGVERKKIRKLSYYNGFQRLQQASMVGLNVKNLMTWKC